MRNPHPWYSTEKRAYFAYIKRRKVRLLKGAESPENEKLAAKQLKQVLKGSKNDVAAGSLRVADVIDRYLTLHKGKYSKEAFAERFYYLQLFAEAHGWRKVNDRDCLPVYVSEWIADHADWKSDWTKAHIVQVVMRPFNWAARQRLIPANPFRGIEQATGEPRRPLTDAEFQSLLRHATVELDGKLAEKRKRLRYASGRKVCPSDRRRRQRPGPAGRFRQALIFLRFTGCRPGELCRLLWTDIDLSAQIIRLKRHKTSKKTKKPRLIPLHPIILKLLIVIRRYGQPGEHVFLNHRRKPWTRRALASRLRRSRAAARIPEDAVLYGLRHAFGTRAILNGVDIKTLSELMGHTNIRMTEHYVALAGQQPHLAAAVLKINPSTTPAAARHPAL
jgi:integrase